MNPNAIEFVPRSFTADNHQKNGKINRHDNVGRLRRKHRSSDHSSNTSTTKAISRPGVGNSVERHQSSAKECIPSPRKNKRIHQRPEDQRPPHHSTVVKFQCQEDSRVFQTVESLTAGFGLLDDEFPMLSSGSTQPTEPSIKGFAEAVSRCPSKALVQTHESHSSTSKLVRDESAAVVIDKQIPTPLFVTRNDLAAEKLRDHWIEVAYQARKRIERQAESNTHDEDFSTESKKDLVSKQDKWYSILKPSYPSADVIKTEPLKSSDVGESETRLIQSEALKAATMSWFQALLADDHIIIQKLLSKSSSSTLPAYRPWDFASNSLLLEDQQLIKSRFHELCLRLNLYSRVDIFEEEVLTGCTALHICCLLGYAASLEIILAMIQSTHRATYVDLKDRATKQTALHIACLLGHLPCARLLMQYDAATDLKDKNGETMLHKAVRSKNQQLVTWIADRYKSLDRLKLNCRSRQGGWTALMLTQSPSIAVALVSIGCDPLVANELGQDSIYLAAKAGNEALLKALLSANRRNSDSSSCHKRSSSTSTSPLFAACESGHLACVRCLLQLGYSYNASIAQRSPFHVAAAMGNVEILVALLEKPSLYHKRVMLLQEDRDGYLPLVYAVMHGQLQASKYLLQEATNKLSIKFGAQILNQILRWSMSCRNGVDEDVYRCIAACLLHVDSIPADLLRGLITMSKYYSHIAANIQLQIYDPSADLADSSSVRLKYSVNTSSMNQEENNDEELMDNDVEFMTADGEILYGQSFLLRRQSPYFESIFRFKDTQQQEQQYLQANSLEKANPMMTYRVDFSQYSSQAVSYYLHWVATRETLIQQNLAIGITESFLIIVDQLLCLAEEILDDSLFLACKYQCHLYNAVADITIHGSRTNHGMVQDLQLHRIEELSIEKSLIYQEKNYIINTSFVALRIFMLMIHGIRSHGMPELSTIIDDLLRIYLLKMNPKTQQQATDQLAELIADLNNRYEHPDDCSHVMRQEDDEQAWFTLTTLHRMNVAEAKFVSDADLQQLPECSYRMTASISSYSVKALSYQAFLDPFDSDVILHVVDDDGQLIRSFHAHRLVLIRSSKLAAMIRYQSSCALQPNDRLIELRVGQFVDDKNSLALYYLLQYLYIDMVPSLQQFLEDMQRMRSSEDIVDEKDYCRRLQVLWIAADEYLVDQLKRRLTKKLCLIANKCNCYQLFDFARCYAIDELTMIAAIHCLSNSNSNSIKEEELVQVLIEINK
jgi:ankyrin repeat protein